MIASTSPTRPWKLPPSAVLNTAQNDLRKRGSGQRYAFLRKHVRPAKSPADLLRRALRDRESGLTAPRVETQLSTATNKPSAKRWGWPLNLQQE